MKQWGADEYIFSTVEENSRCQFNYYNCLGFFLIFLVRATPTLWFYPYFKSKYNSNGMISRLESWKKLILSPIPGPIPGLVSKLWGGLHSHVQTNKGTRRNEAKMRKGRVGQRHGRWEGKSWDARTCKWVKKKQPCEYINIIWLNQKNNIITFGYRFFMVGDD